MSAHVGLLCDVRKIEWREHRIFFDAHERVAKLNIAAVFCFSDLYFSPEAVVFVIRQKQIGAAGSSRDHCVRLRISDKVQQNGYRETFAMFQLEPCEQIDEIEPGSQMPIAVRRVIAGISYSKIAIARHQQIARNGNLSRDSLSRCSPVSGNGEG